VLNKDKYRVNIHSLILILASIGRSDPQVFIRHQS